MSQESTAVESIAQPLRRREAVSTPSRSTVSLDHNGPSSRVVCFGGSNVIVLCREGTEGRSLQVSNVAWPGFVVLAVAILGGFAAGLLAAQYLLPLVAN